MNQDEYDKSRGDEDLQKDFLSRVYNELVLPSEYGKFVSSVDYEYGLVCRHGQAGLFATIPSRRAFYGIRGGKSRIIASSDAFEAYPVWADFSDVLLHHEGMHAKQDFLNPPSILVDTLLFRSQDYIEHRRTIDELEAHNNEMVHITNENSLRYVARLKENIELYKRKLAL